MTDRVLVTGGCGFIGRHVVDLLLQRGDRVRVLDPGSGEGLPAGVEHMRGSAADPGTARAAVADSSRVYHLAGIPHFWAAGKGSLDSANRVAAETVMQACLEARTPRVVHCSTESILLPKRRAGGHAIDESVPPPLGDMPGPYTRSKHLGEQAALAAAAQGLDVVVVNPTVPIGAGDRNMTPPAAMIALFVEGRSPFFLDCTLNLVDVRDLAQGILQAGDRGRSGERYILGGENIRLGELLPRLGRLSGRPMPKRTIPAAVALAAGAVSEWLSDHVTGRPPPATRESVLVALRSAPFDSAKARRELGYAPRPIENALAEAVAWAAARARSAGAVAA